MDYLQDFFSPSEPRYAVYEGTWKDFDRPPNDQLVLTLPTHQANLLTQSLAPVIIFAGLFTWQIIKFPLHSIFQRDRTHEQAPPAPGREIQVSIRNSGGAAGLWLDLLGLGWKRREKIQQSKWLRWKFAAILLFICLFALVFPACSILAAMIDVGDVVRSANTTTCGWWLPEIDDFSQLSLRERLDWTMAVKQLEHSKTTTAENYVNNCYYRDEAAVPFDCSLFSTQSLGLTEETVGCPFDKLCLSTHNQALRLESDPVTFSQLGFNMKHARELSVQRQSVCTTISAGPFAYSRKEVAEQGVDPDAAFITAFAQGSDGEDRRRIWSRYDVSPYTLEGQQVQRHVNVTTPAPPFGSTAAGDEDLTLLYLRSSAFSMEPVSDPWFNLTNPREMDEDYTYSMWQDLSVVACLETARFCSTLGCTPWRAMSSIGSVTADDLLGDAETDGKFRDDLSVFLFFIQVSLPETSLYHALGNRGSAALQATKLLDDNLQLHLDREQWKTELRHWFSISLARLQLASFGVAQLAKDINTAGMENQMAPEFRTALCEGVKFRSNAHRSLSVLGLGIVYGFAIFLFLVTRIKWCVPPRLKERRPLAEWYTDDLLEVLNASPPEKIERGVSVRQISPATSTSDYA